ncbi:S8 family serine peptidase [Amaricoccus tamworthensis]|uniref:S8 family serine peptidase n=1 Tax=Amaricoccus tamworthensis TaxID=57002 RepID=UPI003C7B72D1
MTQSTQSEGPQDTPLSNSAASSRKLPDLTERQWYLSGDPDEPHLNLGGVLDDYDGSGVTIGIWDDGIEYTHHDLTAAYDPDLHVTIDGEVHDPHAQTQAAVHGTAVAGIIAAADNGTGTTGIAHGSRIAVVDILSGTSDVAPRDNFHGLSNFDITSHSWGFLEPWATGAEVPIWKNHLERDLIHSTTAGRDGLGTVNVFAAGNNRWDGDNTNSTGQTQSLHTITVAGLDEDGTIANYSTPGSTILVSAFGEDIWTTDRTSAEGYNTTETRNGNPWADYTAFYGTSAATPQVSAIAALMLEANPGLGWRDVQTILAASARHTGSPLDGKRGDFETDDWDFNAATFWNGGGLHYSNDYGYGLIDGHAAIRLAETWAQTSTTDNLLVDTVDQWRGSKDLHGKTTVSVTFDVDAASVPEMVELELGFSKAELHDYRITLTSPSGTRSILSKPSLDTGRLDTWSFASREFLGEDPVGEWTLHITDRGSDIRTGKLESANLVISGAFATTGRTLIFTDEFSDLADGGFGHTSEITTQDGAFDTVNAAALTTGTTLDFTTGTGTLDGVTVTLPDAFERIVTGDGDDTLTGSDADERLTSGRGDDHLSGENGDDRLAGDDGNDTLSGGSGRDRLAGGRDDDLLRGGSGYDELNGNRGDDTLKGGRGNDDLNGGKGRDRLRDGEGKDTLHGGDDADRFIIETDTDTDHILDFTPGEDTIRLFNTTWSALTITRDNDTTWAVEHNTDLLLVSLTSPDTGRLAASDFDFI